MRMNRHMLKGRNCTELPNGSTCTKSILNLSVAVQVCKKLYITHIDNIYMFVIIVAIMHMLVSMLGNAARSTRLGNHITCRC